MPGEPSVGDPDGQRGLNRAACLELCLDTPDCQTAVLWNPIAEGEPSRCYLYSEHHEAATEDLRNRVLQEVLYCAPVGALLLSHYLNHMYRTTAN